MTAGLFLQIQNASPVYDRRGILVSHSYCCDRILDQLYATFLPACFSGSLSSFSSEKIPITKNAKAYEKLLVFLDQNFVSEIVKRDLDTKVKPEFNEFYEFLKEGFIMDKLVVSLSTKRSSSRS